MIITDDGAWELFKLHKTSELVEWASAQEDDLTARRQFDWGRVEGPGQ